MHFVDQATIVVRGGAGGNGCSAMLRPPFSRHPYASGGDGGPGGNAIMLADPQLATLLDFQFRHEFRAQRGHHGGNNNKTGARGEDRIVRVPVGTVAYDAETDHIVRDFITADEQVVVARGGKGGLGNANASRAIPGAPGQARRLRLELKLIADVGLIGFPNAGKSSLLRRISTAQPKVAAYPFTTRVPVLGVVSAGEDRSFVACDIPGLIEGASQGRGLGAQFLRHIERTRLLVHVIDMASTEGRDPVESYRRVNEELGAHSRVLLRRPQIIAANKMDIPEAAEHLQRFSEEIHEPVAAISCATGEGIPELIQMMWTQLRQLPATQRLVVDDE